MIDEDDVVIKPVQVAAKRDFYWYGKLERYGVELSSFWWDKEFVEKLKNNIPPNLWMKLDKEASRKRSILGYNDDRTTGRKGEKRSQRRASGCDIATVVRNGTLVERSQPRLVSNRYGEGAMVLELGI